MTQELQGVLRATAAALSWAAGAVFVRVSLQHMRSITGTVISLIVGWVMVATLALLFFRDDLSSLPAVAFAWFLVAGAVNFPLGRFFNFNAVRLAGVARATPILSISPLFAAAIAIVFLGETLTLPIALGTVAIITGVILIVTAR